MANFDIFSDKLIGIEGGYSNRKDDLGGETKYGISKRAHPNTEISSLTKEDAKKIYKSEYWDRWNFGSITSQPIAELIFNFMVTNPSETFKSVQKALNNCGFPVKVDGVMGNNTISALNHKLLLELWFMDRFKLEMVNFYNSIISHNRGQLENLHGWINRVVNA